MKQIYRLLLFVFLLSGGTAFSQPVILFSEDFDGMPGSTAGGAGTYSFPSGWLLANVDNRTPEAQVSFVNDAWERREDFGLSVSDSCAFSTSLYLPPGQADDWMWTPAITLTGSNIVLSWRARVYDVTFADGYEVRIMTVPPTGGTGSIGNMESASTILFTISAESTGWSAHSVDISNYRGSQVYIGFRNHSNDKYLLAIDNIKVEKTIPTLFFEDFDGIPGSTFSGPGTYSFPAGWLLVNVDNRTPDGQVAYVNEAWERREDFGLSVTDSCAFSTSFYSPVDQADDWMWTPPINLAGAHVVLSWRARAWDPDFRDGYEVRIMTVPPTGSNGNMGNMLSSALLFITPAENTAWTTHSINLNAYAGQIVYIGFRNNSNDKFLLLIDDVAVRGDIDALPVKLVDFQGNKTAGGNRLTWKVVDQQNIVAYDIERSHDRLPFVRIGTVNANSQSTATYQFTDAAPVSGLNFYRVKINEASGATSYSKTIALQNKDDFKSIRVFPNPANNLLYVLLPGNNTGDVIMISDVAGRRVMQVPVISGNAGLSIDITRLARGIYYLQAGEEVVTFVKE